jgi:hypothetical protein
MLRKAEIALDSTVISVELRYRCLHYNRTNRKFQLDLTAFICKNYLRKR